MSDLFKELCRRAGTAIVRYGMIREGDRVLVALSGGKDSRVLLEVLCHLQTVAPVGFELMTATVDPGFDGFNAGATGETARGKGLKHIAIRLNMKRIIAEKGLETSPCVLCSRLRRGYLYRAARENGCNRLALGQHLDDIAVSFMMSLCRGQGLKTMAPVAVPKKAGEPVVIRPLALVPEEMISRYASTLEMTLAGGCAYKETLEHGDRKYFSGVVKQIAERVPGFYGNLINSLGKVHTDKLL